MTQDTLDLVHDDEVFAPPQRVVEPLHLCRRIGAAFTDWRALAILGVWLALVILA